MFSPAPPTTVGRNGDTGSYLLRIGRGDAGFSPPLHPSSLFDQRLEGKGTVVGGQKGGWERRLFIGLGLENVERKKTLEV